MKVLIVIVDSKNHAEGGGDGTPVQSSPAFAFTRRESEVASWVLEGKSTREIAVQLNLGYETIRSHKKSIMGKMNVHNTTQLLKFLLENAIWSRNERYLSDFTQLGEKIHPIGELTNGNNGVLLREKLNLSAYA